MAEVIGILSGAVTFIDAGNKILGFLSDLRHAPQKIEAHQHHLRTMLQLVQGIRRDLDRLSNGTGVIPPALISQVDLDEVEDLIQQALKKVGELETIFDGLVGRSDITSLERSWKSLRAQDKILERFQDLTLLKDSLQTWLNRQTLLLSSRHRMSLEALGQHIDSAHGDTIKTIEVVESSLIGAMRSSQDNFNHEFGKLRDQNEMLIQLVSRKSQFLESRPITPSIPPPIFTRIVYPAHNKTELTIPPTCTCTSRPAPWNKSWGPVSLRSRTKNVHNRGCPFYGRSAQTVTLSVNLSIFQFVLNGSYGSNGVSFNQNIKNPARIVDRFCSPAFQIMDTFFEYMFYIYSPDILPPSALTGMLNKLIHKLVGLFREGAASVHDQDEYGRTLLWDFVELISCYRYRLGFSEAIPSVIATLVAHGADVNCCSLSMGGLLDRPLQRHWLLVGTTQYGISLESLLFSYGCEPLMEINSGRPAWAAPGTIITCSRDPELAQDLEFPGYYYPIFNKSATDLHMLTQQGQNWNEWNHNFPAPVACAVCWPEGLEILLNAGADIRVALAAALKCDMVDTVQLLVSRNCPSFVDRPFDECPYSSVMRWIDFERGTTAESIILHMSRSREALSQLGLKHLPPGTPLHNHLLEIRQQGTVLDEFAFEIWKALKARAVEIPEYLWPGTCKSVYFEFIFASHISLSDDQTIGARLLYENGFKELDIVDERGWTPLLLACSYGIGDVAEILLEMGARKDPDCQWAYARNYNLKARIPRNMFSEASPLQRDTCSCSCSPSGCLSLVRSLKHQMDGPWNRKTCRSALCKILANGSPELNEVYFFEASRLEVFERLGMAHTCCKDSDGRPYEISMQEYIAGRSIAAEDIEEMKEEDRELLPVLLKYMEMFNKLRGSFKGSAQDFQSVWWVALDLLFPPDEQQVKCAFEGEPEAHLIHGFTGIDPAKSWVDEQGFRVIIQHFSGLLPSITGFAEVCCRADNLEIIEEYVKSMGVSLEHMGYYVRDRRSISRTQQAFVDPAFRPCLDAHRERFKREMVEPVLIPLATAAVIKDIDAGRKTDIPTELYDYLISDGAIVDGKLRGEVADV